MNKEFPGRVFIELFKKGLKFSCCTLTSENECAKCLFSLLDPFTFGLSSLKCPQTYLSLSLITCFSIKTLLSAQSYLCPR